MASNFAQSRAPGVCPNSLLYDIGVYPQVHPIKAAKCISKLVGSLWSTLPNHGLQVHLWVDTVLSSMCISKLAASWPPSTHEFPAHQLRSHRTRCFSQTRLHWLEILPVMLLALSDSPRLLVGAPRLFAGTQYYSQIDLQATASVQKLWDLTTLRF